MLRSLPRATSIPSSLASALRITPRSIRPLAACPYGRQHQQTRSATAHAISNPTLAGIEKRWEGMPPQEQADLWMALRDRMKVDWHEMTLQEKKAGEYAFLPHNVIAFSFLALAINLVLTYYDPPSCKDTRFCIRQRGACSVLRLLIFNLFYSVLDRIRSTWSSSPPRTRRRMEGLLIHNDWGRCLICDLPAHQDTSKSTARYDDKGIPGDDKRVLEGASATPTTSTQ